MGPPGVSSGCGPKKERISQRNGAILVVLPQAARGGFDREQPDARAMKFDVRINAVVLADVSFERGAAECDVGGVTRAGRDEPTAALPRHRRFQLLGVADDERRNVVTVVIDRFRDRHDPVWSAIVVLQRQCVLGLKDSDWFAGPFVSFEVARDANPIAGVCSRSVRSPEAC